ncbi:MAG: glutamine amidotransferase [Rubripirellula sp.]
MLGWILADTYLSWLPAFTVQGFAVMLTVCVMLWVMLRLFWGRSQVRGRIGLWVLRLCSIAILSLILLGPTIVDEQAGEVTRPTMMYLFDGSQSMNLGQEQTRWEESLNFVADAERSAGSSHTSHCQSFRFGHRLKPLFEEPQQPESGSDANQASLAGQRVTTISNSGESQQQEAGILPPEASDTRLGDALRQLLPQVSSKSSAGVVLLSDGRVRASESVERLAEFFGESGVPLHVVPIGQATGTGDIAVVSLVVPNRVRKYTENELQVFLRSFGFTGQRTTVRIVSKSRIGQSSTSTLASVPITLSGGAQSVSLTFRVNEQPEDLEIIVDPIEGELTERNNQVSTRVEIDRTKVRVLYVESDGSSQPQSVFSQVFSAFGSSSNRSATDLSTVQQALQSDEDVECTVLVSSGGSAPRQVSENRTATSAGFPKTRAELFAYDCVVFSNVGPNVLDEQQVDWLAQWVEGRGGGLIVTGGDALKEDAWKDTPLEPLLPLDLSRVSSSGEQTLEISPTLAQHAVWRLRLEERLNDELLKQLPPLSVSGLGYQPKSTAEILAERSDDGSPVLMAHRAGRGRILASTASLGGNSLSKLANSWGPQPERVAAKFWRNMVYWATEGSSTGRRRLVAQSDKRFYRPGEPLSVLATAYDEGARRTKKYRLWAMFEPASLDDMSLYSPILWPDNVVRESGEVGPRIAWGEELQLKKDPNGDGYQMDLMLSETSGVGDSGFRIEMTAYEGAESSSAFDHGTQVDSTSLAIQILSDPFEQQNPLPNHELMQRLATVSGGEVLETPADLAKLLKNRRQTEGLPKRDVSPAWSHWALWLCLLGLLSSEWIWRRVTGLA